MKESVGSRIVSRLNEFADALESGAKISEKFTVRKLPLNFQPGQYDSEAVQKTRSLMGLSQTLFARFLGVSPATVRAWEQGNNVPSEIARRFMDEIRIAPDYWQKRLAIVAVMEVKGSRKGSPGFGSKKQARRRRLSMNRRRKASSRSGHVVKAISGRTG